MNIFALVFKNVARWVIQKLIIDLLRKLRRRSKRRLFKRSAGKERAIRKTKEDHDRNPTD